MNKLIFTQETLGLIIEALGFKTTINGYVIDSNGAFVNDVDGNKFKPEQLIGVHKDKFFTHDSQLLSMAEKENPIKDNRIVKDKTFALRLLGFALDTQCGDACGEDEKESMVSYATSLLKYQIETATDQSEIDYLERCDAREKLKKGLSFLGVN